MKYRGRISMKRPHDGKENPNGKKLPPKRNFVGTSPFLPV